MLNRFSLDILLILSIFLMPWWISTIFTVALLLYINSYYEAIFLGFFFDFAYSIPTELFFGFRFVFSVLFIFIFLISGPLKRRLRYYHK